MNSSLLYVGHNVSDGMPNTLLEAICFGAFPIQSNPGGASAEVINDRENGLLIHDCDDVKEIVVKMNSALSNKKMLEVAFEYNMKLRERLSFEYIQERVQAAYQRIL